MGFREFVAFVAGCMALNALSIDVMLPALPHLARDLGVTDANTPQLIIIVYLAGFAVAQLIFGPLSDRYGRKPVLIGGMAIYGLASLLSTLSTSFDQLLLARVLQGVGGAAPRVIAQSLIRDRYQGPDMGRVLSLALMIFMATPILAPSIGQLILLIAPWRWVFAVLAIGGLLMFVWTCLRLEETLPVSARRSFSPRSVGGAYREAISTPTTLTYTLATGLCTGGIFGFVTSAQQIFQDGFGLGGEFTLVFAMIAASVIPASFLNARWVRRYGLRGLSHRALAVFILNHATITALALAGLISLWIFVALQFVAMFLLGFLIANFSALAIQPLGHIAGTASSLIGALSTALAALMGYFIGQAFDGSVLPLAMGSALLGCAAMGLILIHERGRFAREPGADAGT